MIESLSAYVLENWASLGLPGPRPARVSFLKVGTSRIGPKAVFLLFAAGSADPALCAKTVRTPELTPLLDHEYQALRTVEARLRGSLLEGSVPRALGRVRLLDDELLLETAAQGQRLAWLTPDAKGFQGALEALQAWLVEFHRRNRVGEAKVDEAFLEEHVRGPVRELIEEAELPAPQAGVLLAMAGEFPPGARLPLSEQHGDLTSSNVLLGPAGVQAVDFQLFGHTPLPLYDLFTFLKSLRPGGDFGALVSDTRLLGAVSDYARALELEAGLIRPLAKVHLVLRRLGKARRDRALGVRPGVGQLFADLECAGRLAALG